MTQKHLGTVVGFPEKSADVRLAQYETGTRTEGESDQSLTNALEISPLALNIPDIDSYLGLMHTLFTLEDRYGLTIEDRNGQVVFHIDRRRGKDAARISEMVYAWAPVAEKYRAGEISREEYDNWRYHYPKYGTTQNWAIVPSQELSDALVEASKRRIEE